MSSTSAAARFEGFPTEAFDFFAQLALHNEREWFRAHQEQYERACRDPMRLLVEELGGDSVTSKITRINRDTRFSRNKAPYRTYIAAGVDGNYIQFSASGLYVATGFYKPEPPVLERFRNAIDDDKAGRRLEKIVTAIRAKGYEIGTHERLKTVPRGYPPTHPRVELLRMKDLFAGKTFGDEWLSTREALRHIRRTIDDVRPLREWVEEHVDPRH